MKLIVSGPSVFPNQLLFQQIIEYYTKKHRVNVLAVGQESGIETMAVEWAMKKKIKLCIVRNQNDTYQARNERLAELHSDANLVLHFKGSEVSEDLCKRMQSKNIPIDDVILD